MEISNKVTNKLTDRITTILISLFFILKPFYFWQSGLPQVADFILLLAILIYLVSKKFKIIINKNLKKFIVVNCLFAFYVFFINATWSLILNGELSFFRVSLFYLYNSIVSIFFTSFLTTNSRDTYKIIYISVLVSTILQLVILVVSGGFIGGRIVAFFNNPNQLGYHSLLTLAIMLFSSTRLNIRVRWFLIGIFSSAILCMSSLSKSAIVSYFFMLLFFILFKKRHSSFSRKITIFLILFIVTIAIIYQFNEEIFNSNLLLISVKQRLSTIGQDNDDSLSGRGYDRIWTHKKYLLFGAGEGYFSRFGSTMEIHSTLGNILISYGIIGLGMFLFILYAALKQNMWKDFYLMFFIMLYGLTHNGIRNTIFWVLIALICVNNEK